MSSASIILSSAGLKNITFNDFNCNDQFYFNFGDYEFNMNKIFAEFISPMVSRHYHTDSTINSIHFEKLFHNFETSSNKYTQSYRELFTEEIISIIKQISSGISVEINREQSFQLQLISVLLENEELYNKIDEIYPIEIDEYNVDLYLQHLQFFLLFFREF